MSEKEIIGQIRLEIVKEMKEQRAAIKKGQRSPFYRAEKSVNLLMASTAYEKVFNILDAFEKRIS